MSSNLPDWPDREACHKYHLKNGTDGWIEDADYYNDLSDAALARMEALAEELRDLAAVALPHKDERYMRIHALLAACDRSKGCK